MNTCPICLDPIYKNSFTIFECKHKFHKKCFKKWYSNNNNCPYCRTFIPYHFRIKFKNKFLTERFILKIDIDKLLIFRIKKLLTFDIKNINYTNIFLDHSILDDKNIYKIIHFNNLKGIIIFRNKYLYITICSQESFVFLVNYDIKFVLKHIHLHIQNYIQSN